MTLNSVTQSLQTLQLYIASLYTHIYRHLLNISYYSLLVKFNILSASLARSLNPHSISNSIAFSAHWWAPLWSCNNNFSFAFVLKKKPLSPFVKKILSTSSKVCFWLGTKFLQFLFHIFLFLWDYRSCPSETVLYWF